MAQRKAQEHINEKVIFGLLHPRAEAPQRERVTDVTEQVTLLSRTNNRTEDNFSEVNTFSTGLEVIPPLGYYYEVVANPHLYKMGYSLISPLIINHGDRGELVVPLFKFKDCEDLDMPFKAVMLVLRPAIYAYRTVNNTPIQNLGQNRMTTPVEGGYYAPSFQQGNGNHMF